MNRAYIQQTTELSAEELHAEVDRLNKILYENKSEYYSRYSEDGIELKQWLSMLVDYICEVQRDECEARMKLAEYNRDEEIVKLKDKIEKLRQEQSYGFPITKAEYQEIINWQQDHDEKVHGLNIIQKKLRAGGAIGGRYSFKFIPTSIGVVGTCICGNCGAEFKFQDL